MFLVSPYIAEFWNTLSNLPFVIIKMYWRVWLFTDRVSKGSQSAIQYP